jgi:hypothetical protein
MYGLTYARTNLELQSCRGITAGGGGGGGGRRTRLDIAAVTGGVEDGNCFLPFTRVTASRATHTRGDNPPEI